jgi:hypothetical protein
MKRDDTSDTLDRCNSEHPFPDWEKTADDQNCQKCLKEYFNPGSLLDKLNVQVSGIRDGYSSKFADFIKRESIGQPLLGLYMKIAKKLKLCLS